MSRITTGVAAVLLVCSAAVGSAETITVYTDKADWQNAVSQQYLTEGFADDLLNPRVSFVSAESGHINPAQDCYQDVLASTSQNEPMTTWSFTPQVTGYGGNWALGGPGGSGNSLLVYIADSDVYVGFISNSYSGGFWGFTSDIPFNSVRLIGGGGSNQQNYCLDDMVYSPVPLPTVPGDANGDGTVTDADYTIWADYYGADAATWATGDFNGDGLVSDADYTIWADNYGMSLGGVPEPATLGLLALGAPAAFRRRR